MTLKVIPICRQRVQIHLNPARPAALHFCSLVTFFPFPQICGNSSGSWPPLSAQPWLLLCKEAKSILLVKCPLLVWNGSVTAPFPTSEPHPLREYLLLLCSWFLSSLASLAFLFCPAHFYSPSLHHLSNWKYMHDSSLILTNLPATPPAAPWLSFSSTTRFLERRALVFHCLFNVIHTLTHWNLDLARFHSSDGVMKIQTLRPKSGRPLDSGKDFGNGNNIVKENKKENVAYKNYVPLVEKIKNLKAVCMFLEPKLVWKCLDPETAINSTPQSGRRGGARVHTCPWHWPQGHNKSCGWRPCCPVRAWSQLGENQTKEKQRDILPLVLKNLAWMFMCAKKKGRSPPLSMFMPMHPSSAPFPVCSPVLSLL